MLSVLVCLGVIPGVARGLEPVVAVVQGVEAALSMTCVGHLLLKFSCPRKKLE